MSKPITYEAITVLEPEAPSKRAVIRAGGISLNLRTLQENIDARRNGTLSWSHLIQSIEKTAHVAGQPMRKGELFRLLRPELEARLGHKLTNLEQAKLGSNAPLMGFAATVCEHFKLDTKAPQLGRILMETETRSLEKGATMAAGTPLHILVTAPSADTCEALRITDEESAAKAWEKLIMREVIVRARAMNPEHYTDHLSNAQVWAMLVNTVCNLQHDKDSPFAGIEFDREDKQMLWDMQPVEDFSKVFVAHLGIEGTELAKHLMFCENAAVNGLQTDKDGKTHVEANKEARAMSQARDERDGMKVSTTTFVLSGPALNPGDPPSTHAQAHHAGRAVEMGENRYGAILDIISEARRQKGWKHRTDPQPDRCASGPDEGRAR